MQTGQPKKFPTYNSCILAASCVISKRGTFIYLTQSFDLLEIFASVIVFAATAPSMLQFNIIYYQILDTYYFSTGKCRHVCLPRCMREGWVHRYGPVRMAPHRLAVGADVRSAPEATQTSVHWFPGHGSLQSVLDLEATRASFPGGHGGEFVAETCRMRPEAAAREQGHACAGDICRGRPKKSVGVWKIIISN